MELQSIKHDREGVNMQKISHGMKTLFGHTRMADAFVEKFSQIDIPQLREKTKKKIKNVLLDVDACIAPAYKDILPENLEHIKKLQEHVKIGIYSNCKGAERLTPLYKMGIYSYEGARAKPEKEGFLDACAHFRFDPSETIMIGDNPNTDGGAVGVLEGVVFVKGIPEDFSSLPFHKKLILPVQNLLRDFALFITKIGNKRLSSTLKK